MSRGQRTGRGRSWLGHGIAFALGAILAGAALGHAGPRETRLGALDALAQSLSYVATEYVEPRTERELIYDAIRGMIGRLDRHSRFFAPAAFRKLREDTEGEFGGVGLELGRAPAGTSHPVAVRVVPGSPAARAGVREGEALLAVDGVDTAGAALPALNRRLRGPAGSRVELRLGGPRVVTLVRAQVKVPTVSARDLGRGVGYLAIRRFQEATFADCQLALAELGGARGGLGALILDLRDNPGGLFDQAIKIADLFLTDGIIVTVRSRGRETERHLAHRAGTHAPIPMAVLIDQSSASAAEVLAAALGDHRRATLIGAPSFGKGSVQTLFELPDGSGLKLTTAHYVTPSGRSLDGVGLAPDHVVEAFADEVVVVGGGASPPESAVDPGVAGLPADLVELLADDPQLRAALDLARGWVGGSESRSGTGARNDLQPRAREGISTP